MKLVTVRIGNKYGPEYETYLEKNYPIMNLYGCENQYKIMCSYNGTKMYGMNLDIDEPICVMDIDVLLINDYKKIFEFSIEKGEFLLMLVGGEIQIKSSIKLMVGSLNTILKDVKYIYEKFMSNLSHVRTHYIKK